MRQDKLVPLVFEGVWPSQPFNFLYLHMLSLICHLLWYPLICYFLLLSLQGFLLWDVSIEIIFRCIMMGRSWKIEFGKLKVCVTKKKMDLIFQLLPIITPLILDQSTWFLPKNVTTFHISLDKNIIGGSGDSLPFYL